MDFLTQPISASSVLGTQVPIVRPDPRAPSVRDVSVTSDGDVVYTFVNGDSCRYSNFFPVFDSTIAASGNQGCIHDLMLDQSDILVDEVAAANRKLSEAIHAGTAPDLPPEIRDWILVNGESNESPPSEFGFTWRAHETTGRMQLVDNELLAHAINTSGTNLWGRGCAAMETDEPRLSISAAVGDPSEEAVERKRRSEQRLRTEDVKTLDRLPPIGDTDTTKLRSVEDVSARCVALMLVALKADGIAQGAPPEHIATLMGDLIERFEARPDFTARELAFIDAPSPEHSDVTEFGWRYESLWTLLWALGYVQTLGQPSEMCTVDVATSHLLNGGRQSFGSGANLRDPAEILDESDLIYRYNWAVTDGRINGTPISFLDAGVVRERHHALNWLICYLEQPWDDVQTDT